MSTVAGQSKMLERYVAAHRERVVGWLIELGHPEMNAQGLYDNIAGVHRLAGRYEALAAMPEGDDADTAAGVMHNVVAAENILIAAEVDAPEV